MARPIASRPEELGRMIRRSSTRHHRGTVVVIAAMAFAVSIFVLASDSTGFAVTNARPDSEKLQRRQVATGLGSSLLLPIMPPPMGLLQNEPTYATPQFSTEFVDEGLRVHEGGQRVSLMDVSHHNMYPAVQGSKPFAAGKLQYFEVELDTSGVVSPHRTVSLRVGSATSHPSTFLGAGDDEVSFWVDDGDAYNAGQRRHAGGMDVSVPMGHGDRIGVLVDMRKVGVGAPIEFVLNKRSTGPVAGAANVFSVTEPLFPYVSFCQNNVGCSVKLTHFDSPPSDIIPWDPASSRDAQLFMK